MTKKNNVLRIISLTTALLLCVSLCSCFGKKDDGEDYPGNIDLSINSDSISDRTNETKAPAETQPQKQTETEAPKPAETVRPAETAKPAETAAPKPAETAAPQQPSAPSLGDRYSGSFKSSTGLGIDLKADWTAEQIGVELYLVTVDVKLVSYSISVSARGDNYVRLGDSRLNFGTEAIEIEADDRQSEKLLNTLSFRITADEFAKGTELEAVWNFNGTYSGTYTGAITVSGMVTAG